MTVVAERGPLTVEEFMNLPDSRDYELIDGQLVERKKVGARASYIAGQIMGSIVAFVRSSPSLGWTFDADTIYRCFGPGHTGRRFDLSFIRCGRLPGEVIPDADIRIAPDLAVEIVSPNDLAYEVNDKVLLYRAAGVPLIWIVYPETRSIQIFQPDGSAIVVESNQEISGESVLPGFKANVSDFFPPVKNVETAPDPVA